MLSKIMQKFCCEEDHRKKKLHQLQHSICDRTPGINSSLDRDEIRCFAYAIKFDKRMPHVQLNRRSH